MCHAHSRHEASWSFLWWLLDSSLYELYSYGSTHIAQNRQLNRSQWRAYLKSKLKIHQRSLNKRTYNSKPNRAVDIKIGKTPRFRPVFHARARKNIWRALWSLEYLVRNTKGLSLRQIQNCLQLAWIVEDANQEPWKLVRKTNKSTHVKKREVGCDSGCCWWRWKR